MSKMQRDKGARWEREVAARLRDVFQGQEIRRGQQGDGAVRPDVVCPLIWVECKAGGAWTYEGAINQACEDSAKAGGYGAVRWPVVLAKRDRRRALAVMDLDDFLDLLEVLWGEVKPRAEADPVCRLEVPK